MADLFSGYKGGSFGSVLPSMMNAAVQRQNTPPRFNIPRNERTPITGAHKGSNYLSQRQDAMAPVNYQKYKEQTLGATIAGINELRNETKTETVQIPIETMPAGGMVEAEKYYSLNQKESDLTQMISDLEKDSAIFEDGLEALDSNLTAVKVEDQLTADQLNGSIHDPKTGKNIPKSSARGRELAGFPEEPGDQTIADNWSIASSLEKRKAWTESFNDLQIQKMEAEDTLAMLKLSQEKNLEAGGGPIETEVHEAYREVPTDNASKRDAAMKMVAEVAGKVGGQAAATLYQEVDRLYPTTRTATTHVDDQGKPIGWQPSGMNTLVQARGQGQFPAELFGKMEVAGATYNPATGSTSYNLKPLESRETLVKFPGAAKPMYANTKENAAMINETLSQFDPLMMGIDQLLEIAKSGKTFKKLDPVTRRKASIIQATLIGNIRTQIVGPGVVSNFDYQQLLKAVNNPTTIFDVEMILGGDQVSIQALQTLQTAMYNALLAKSGMAGFTGGGQYKIPKQYRRFNSVEDARRLGFQSGDVVNILGADPRKPNEYAPGKLD